MKREALHLQILSYLKEQKEIVNLEKVFEKFLNEEQGLLIQNDVSECRGEGCFKRMSAILFAINRLQEDRQIVLGHINAEIPKDYSESFKNPIKIGNTDKTLTDGKVTGYYQDLLKEHILSSIYVAEEADAYIKREGISKELKQARTQTCLTWITIILAFLTLVASIIKQYLL